MTNPWMIMVVGVLTVFIALFVMILFLLAFPKLFVVLKRKEHGNLAPLPQIIEVTKKPATIAPVGVTAEATAEDASLIAVLTAAIVAASGASASTFAITKVRQTESDVDGGFNTPVWGRVERLSRK